MFLIIVSLFLAAAIVVAGIVFKQRAIAIPVAVVLPIVVILAEAFTVVSAGHVGVQVTLGDRKSTRLNSSHIPLSRMPSSA